MSFGVGDIIMKIKKPLNSSELRVELKAILSDMVRAYEGKPQPVANYNLATYAVKIEDLIEEQKKLVEIKDLERIEQYIKDREYNIPEFSISCRVMLDGKIKYCARFLMVDTEDNDNTDFVRADGGSLEEVVGKIAGYLKSGEHYKDGRYL